MADRWSYYRSIQIGRAFFFLRSSDYVRANVTMLALMYGLVDAGVAGRALATTFVVVPFARRERWAWFSVCSSVLAWLIGAVAASRELTFVSEPLPGISVLVAAALLIPLMMTWPSFRQRQL